MPSGTRNCAACHEKLENHRHLITSNEMLAKIMLFHFRSRKNGVKARQPKVGDSVCCRHFIEGHAKRIKDWEANLCTHFVPRVSDSPNPRRPLKRQRIQEKKKKKANRRRSKDPPIPRVSLDDLLSNRANSSVVDGQVTQGDQFSHAEEEHLSEQEEAFEKEFNVSASTVPEVLRDSLMAAAAGDLQALAEAQIRLRQHVEDLKEQGETTVPLPIFELAITAAAHGIERNHAFSLTSVLQRGLLHYYTSFYTKEDLCKQLVAPLERWYRSNSKHQPRSSFLLEDRVLWCLTLLHRNTLYSGLYKLLHPLSYPGTKKNMVKLVKKTFKHLKQATNSIRLPTLEEWRKMNTGAGVEKFPDSLLLFIDGTSLPLRKPCHSQLSRMLWVNYKKHYAMRYFVLTTADGTIVYISELGAGNESDQKQYQKSQIANKLAQAYPTAPERLILGGDKGYIHCSAPKGFQLVLTQSAEKEAAEGSEQTEDDSQQTSEFIASLNMCVPRSVIERSIGKIKQFGCLSQGLIRWKDSYPLEEMVYLAAVVANNRLEAKKNKDQID